MPSEQHDIRHDSGGRRFTITVDGHQGYVDYEREEDTLALTHTVVPPAIGGRGIAGQLVRSALDYARSERLKVVPRCSYAADWIGKHPEYADLLA